MDAGLDYGQMISANRLEARTVNQFGVAGPISAIELER